MNKQKILFLISTLILVIGIVGYNYYQNIFGELVTKDGAIYIGSNETINDVEKELFDFLGDDNNFNWLAQQKKYLNPKAGKYILTKGMSLNDVINLLRSGNQTPIKVSFNNQDTLEKFSGRISTQIEADSISILEIFKDPVFLKNNKLTEASVLGILIPNTYEFYWNASAETVANKLYQNTISFWTPSRIRQAKELGLTPGEVSTLASIVIKESSKADDRPKVARLYLNRLATGMKLQADPTVIYAIQQEKPDAVVQRVLRKDLTIDSPYNTYKNVGLPPGPICVPEKAALLAVLEAPEHDYIFMCADPDQPGYHAFARNYAGHLVNQRKWTNWLNSRKIYR